ncbi:MAG: hypothetical protein PHH08_00545 [Candidatus ainarchaeum sp.]|nr:hypothetical protein [Candidatus ainarchaeum sp.]
MFLEFISHAFALDFQWIAELVLGNLHWVALLAAYAFIMHNGKKWFWQFIFLVGGLWIFLDIAGLWGIALFPIMLFLMFSIALEFFEEGNWIARHKTGVVWVSFFGLSFLYTLFWAG